MIGGWGRFERSLLEVTGTSVTILSRIRIEYEIFYVVLLAPQFPFNGQTSLIRRASRYIQRSPSQRRVSQSYQMCETRTYTLLDSRTMKHSDRHTTTGTGRKEPLPSVISPPSHHAARDAPAIPPGRHGCQSTRGTPLYCTRPLRPLLLSLAPRTCAPAIAMH
jgi:hypothetical protein